MVFYVQMVPVIACELDAPICQPMLKSAIANGIYGEHPPNADEIEAKQRDMLKDIRVRQRQKENAGTSFKSEREREINILEAGKGAVLEEDHNDNSVTHVCNAHSDFAADCVPFTNVDVKSSALSLEDIRKLSMGNTLEISFTERTEMPPVRTKEDIDAIIHFTGMNMSFKLLLRIFKKC